MTPTFVLTVGDASYGFSIAPSDINLPTDLSAGVDALTAAAVAQYGEAVAAALVAQADWPDAGTKVHCVRRGPDGLISETRETTIPWSRQEMATSFGQWFAGKWEPAIREQIEQIVAGSR